MRCTDKHFVGKRSQHVNPLRSMFRKWYGSQDPNGKTSRATSGY
ncbi:hypothetical protein BURMUCGD1_6377 [Burkholderia multivorans CGD1]|nr:hypothetical protein BURMUCGD1_6377 [Burkholderia multivorans CGD1]